ncbi:MAG: ComEC family competence protein [Alphaproteobacteria bacterium]|jgi:competence protein ComEC|nr:ComEC family competence protein [Alphaproteobacteria bacterium]
MAALSTAFFEDQSRWFLWWPVGMGIGISTYFSLSYEPSLSDTALFLFISLLLFGVGMYYRRHNYLSLILSLALLSLSIGFVAAKIRTHQLATPFLLTKMDDVQITGRIVDIEEQPNRHRITLDQLNISENVDLHKIRLTLPLSKDLTVAIGDHVSLQTSLLPLSDPVSVYGYNFRRQAYFQGIGATGRIKGPIQVIDKNDKYLWLESMRYRLTQTIRRLLPGQTGEVAAALITGDRSGILPIIRQAFTDAGLAHILAISGLHLTLVAGLVFLVFRRSLALIPFLAENYPIKKWTAVLVILATFAYLCISGFGIPGQRAFVMITIVMVGILLDRNPLSMRLVVIAGTLILLFRPESLLSASFQLSFAAVVGLIAAYEGGWAPLRQWSLEGGYFRRLVAYGTGLIATTLVATLATTPYTVAIFNRFTLQTIVGNFLAIPLTSIVIMPAATLSVLTLPFGGSSLIFSVFSFGLESLIQIAKMVSSWPGAAIVVATPPPAFLALLTLGGLWVCFWKRSWRWGGLILCGLGCLTPLLSSQPSIYAAGDGSVLAYHKDNILYVSDLKRGRFFTDQWMKELGLRELREWPETRVKLGSVLLINHPYSSPYTPLQMTRERCSVKALVTTGYAWKDCKRLGSKPKILIDRYTLKRDGTYQIWISETEVCVKSVRKSLGKRPWSCDYKNE